MIVAIIRMIERAVRECHLVIVIPAGMLDTCDLEWITMLKSKAILICYTLGGLAPIIILELIPITISNHEVSIVINLLTECRMIVML